MSRSSVSTISSLPSPTHFNVKAGLSTSVKLSRADQRRLQVIGITLMLRMRMFSDASQLFERHIEKHSPMQHGERLCQKCEQILGQTFANHLLDTSLSSPSSSTPSSLSSASSGRPHHSAFCQSYQVLVTQKQEKGIKTDILRPISRRPTHRVQTSSSPLKTFRLLKS